MNNDFENNNGTAPGENSAGATPPTEENTTYHYAYKPAGGTGQNPQPGSGFDSAQGNGASAANQGANAGPYANANAGASNPQGGYNYSQGGSYYTPPQQQAWQPQGEPPKKEKKHRQKKAKAVKLDENGNPIPQKKNKTTMIICIVIAICAAIAVVGLVASATSKSGSDSKETTTASSSAQVKTEEQESVPTKDNSGNYTVAGVAQNNMDSCVGITVYSQASSYSSFYGYGSDGNSSSDGNQTKSSEGSGVLMLEDGGKTYIMTCAHVISGGSSFTVTLNDGTEYDASMVAYDSQTDIGVLSINATGLKIATFANSDSVAVGEQVVAIGCPGGIEFMNSVTSGYVSAIDRPVSSKIGYDNKCIQTDAAINPGNSGGALFNMQGQVIGINSSKIASTEYEGMGFAVPSNTAVSTANSLIKSGYVEGRAKLGITYNNISSYSNASAILSALSEKGYKDANGTMVIGEVSSDSDLANKDIKQYDMIVAVNGNTMTDTDVMTSVLSDSKPGDTIKLTIARIENNQIKTFDVGCKLVESKGSSN
ncbi:MAG: trypsin-like peptidase domain-containing protein [Eubacterium sp.]|nr:trypsin-like peptidase domain-containing protein [Eubacterium sp.]